MSRKESELDPNHAQHPSDPDCETCEHDHEHTPVRLKQTLVA